MSIEDTKLQVLNDHYKDTFSQIREYIKLRDRLLVFILLSAALMLLQIYSPKEFSDAVAKLIAKNIESNSFTDLSFIGTIIWFLLTGLSLRYFQTVVLIEKQYEYLHSLEEYIRTNFRINVFEREGRHYLKNYPLLSDFAFIIYTKVFPLLMMAVAAVKIAQELTLQRHLQSMLFYRKGLQVCKTPLPFVDCARKAPILRVQIWSAHESDVVGLNGMKERVFITLIDFILFIFLLILSLLYILPNYLRN